MAQIVPKLPERGPVDPVDQALCGPPGPLGCGDPRVERTRTAVLRAARQILDEKGWSAVTHLAVSERSGVGRTTLYRHWPDAESLLRDVIGEWVEIDHALPSGDLHNDLVAELETFRLRMLDPVCERSMATVVERATVDPDYAKLRAAITSECTRQMATLCRAARTRGQLRPGTDIETAIDELAGPLAFRHLFARRPLTAEFVEQVVADFLAAHGPDRPGEGPAATAHVGPGRAAEVSSPGP